MSGGMNSKPAGETSAKHLETETKAALQLPQNLTVPQVLDRDYIARTLRTSHEVDHKKTDFWACRSQPCSEIEELYRRLVADEMKTIYERVPTEIRRDFDHMCNDGCSPWVLDAYLNIAARGLAGINHSIWDLYHVSPKEWKKFSKKVETFAGEIEAFTRDKSIGRFLTDYWLSSVPRLCPIDERPGMIQRQLHTYQRTLPSLLREFARSLRQPLNGINSRVGTKRWDTRRQGILNLLSYVRARTRKPHWDAVSNVLGHFAGQYGADYKRARTVDADALRKIWKRARKYGILPTAA